MPLRASLFPLLTSEVTGLFTLFFSFCSCSPHRVERLTHLSRSKIPFSCMPYHAMEVVTTIVSACPHSWQDSARWRRQSTWYAVTSRAWKVGPEDDLNLGTPADADRIGGGKEPRPPSDGRGGVAVRGGSVNRGAARGSMGAAGGVSGSARLDCIANATDRARKRRSCCLIMSSPGPRSAAYACASARILWGNLQRDAPFIC